MTNKQKLIKQFLESSDVNYLGLFIAKGRRVSNYLIPNFAFKEALETILIEFDEQLRREENGEKIAILGIVFADTIEEINQEYEELYDEVYNIVRYQLLRSKGEF